LCCRWVETLVIVSDHNVLDECWEDDLGDSSYGGEDGEGGSGWVVEDEGWDYLSAF